MPLFSSIPMRVATCGAILTVTSTMVLQARVVHGSLFERILNKDEGRRRGFAFGQGHKKAFDTPENTVLSRKRKLGKNRDAPSREEVKQAHRRHLSQTPPLYSPPLVTEGLLEFHLEGLDAFDDMDELSDSIWMESLSMSLTSSSPLQPLSEGALSFSVYYISDQSFSVDFSTSIGLGEMFSLDASLSLSFEAMSINGNDSMSFRSESSPDVSPSLSFPKQQGPSLLTMPTVAPGVTPSLLTMPTVAPGVTSTPSLAPVTYAATTLEPTRTLSRHRTPAPTSLDPSGTTTPPSQAPTAALLQKGPANPTTTGPSPLVATSMPWHEITTAEPTSNAAIRFVPTTTRPPSSHTSHGPFTCSAENDDSVSSNSPEAASSSDVNVTIAISLLTAGDASGSINAIELALIQTMTESLLACNETLSSLSQQTPPILSSRTSIGGDDRRFLESEPPHSVAVQSVVSTFSVDSDCEGVANNTTLTCILVETMIMLQVEGGSLPPVEVATTARDAVADAISDGSLLPAQNEQGIQQLVFLAGDDSFTLPPTVAPTAREGGSADEREGLSMFPTISPATAETEAPTTTTDNTGRRALPTAATGLLSVAAVSCLSVVAFLIYGGCRQSGQGRICCGNLSPHVALEVEDGGGGGRGSGSSSSSGRGYVNGNFSSESDVEAFSVRPMDPSPPPSVDVSVTTEDYSTSAASAGVRIERRRVSSSLMGSEGANGGLSDGEFGCFGVQVD